MANPPPNSKKRLLQFIKDTSYSSDEDDESVLDEDEVDVARRDVLDQVEKERRQINAENVQLIQTTKNVSLAKLVRRKSGVDVFDALCMHIDINAKYAELLPQWQDVARELGLDEAEVTWVDVCVRPKEGLTRAVLELYMADGGTLGDVLDALHKLELLQVLQTIKPKVKAYLKEDELEDAEMEEPDKAFYSTWATLKRAFGKQPDPAFLTCTKAFESRRNEILVQSAVIFDPKTHNKSVEAPNGDKSDLNKSRVMNESDKRCRILLLFAEDGVEAANSAHNIITSTRYDNIAADVFRLNETFMWFEMLSNPEASCVKWASEADFVIPVLTPKFLKQIHGHGEMSGESLLPTSAMINRFMHTLLRARYVEAGCKNKVVRPVIPSEHLAAVARSGVVKTDPLFRNIWVELESKALAGRVRGMLAQLNSNDRISI